MVAPPTLQRHELGKSIHATFLYPTSFLPADTRYNTTAATAASAASMYTAGAQHSSSRLSLRRPAPRDKLLLCVNVAGPEWASPEKRSRPAHGWKGRPRSWQRSVRWYQAFCFFFAGTRRSLVPHTKTKTIFFHSKTKISRTHTQTDFFFGMYRYQLETRFARINGSIRDRYLRVPKMAW